MRNLIQSALPAAALLLSLSVIPAVAQPLRVQSPTARTQVEFTLSEGGVPTYRVLYRNKVVLDDAPLGLDLGRNNKLGHGMTVQGSSSEDHDSRVTLTVGKTRQARDHYRQLRVQLVDAAQHRLEIELRAYDDGVALRYVLPKAGKLEIRNELTSFAFPRDYPCWTLNLGRFGTSHEGEYDAIAASKLRPHNLLELPLVCQTDAQGTTLAIGEANLRDYAGLYLTGRADGGLGVSAKLSPRLDQPALAVSIDAQGRDFATPWRVIMLGDTPASLIDSNLITLLNPPPAFDASWVRPGKSAWDWWSGSLASGVAQPGMNTATIQRYIDHAHQLKLEYMLIDDGWYHGSTGDGQYNSDADIRRPVEQLDLPGLVTYGRQRGVGLWLWAHWRALDAHMDEALAWYQQLGIKGIKVDFMDRDDQQMVDFYHRLLAKAAEHKLLVDLHGAYHPTGLIRTYPNYLTQEGVLGAEYNKWTTRITATHNLTLPFTRMLLGPMDYTPGGFRNVRPAAFKPQHIAPQVMTTRAQQLAMYVVYESPFAVVSDRPEQYENVPAAQFLRDVPASWDETRAIEGAIGEHIVLARRSGKDWYVGAMTNEQARTLQVPLTFLDKGTWTATIYADGAAPTEVNIETRKLTRNDTLQLQLAASGGAAIRLHKK
ncbi:glycoside hydrolase family 97 protein [Xanthomonas campestris pv. campestris]|uniref:Exported putative alpha-glucosidase n=1 Tax=Xanthomonas campestris pv. campestris (strain B100) TaxID=509169 RepID=B0RPH7_XANCB|nr:glycoside hydrolase family 97 protein [Xanthomonas campestris]MCD0255579.1 glycoside hydrolase family 97 protein [Xanthomonas campestris pv. campestris]MCD0273975.1 glycoside hydrolase family 97 protein [Xanthomonas campestris pv. campestris]MCF8788265.1 glycoside hydrolase family 97 protein [Xanthomonas campestris pv. campestris]MCF8800749.1 glycoside hydrolase family 97 protein [Xanthomonas campestris pv. campestris]MCF8804816.1 glycoside hydrolase family 97 protein [Xanthomonas campestri